MSTERQLDALDRTWGSRAIQALALAAAALGVALLVACGSGPVEGPGPVQRVESDPVQRRGARVAVALVIGNAAYKSEEIADLKNPVRDATLMRDALKEVGFQVKMRRDLGRVAFLEALTEFGQDAGSAEAVVFYYAGHATAEGGENYMLPVDMPGLRRDDGSAVNYGDHAVQLTRAMDELRGRQNVVFLDACRTPPERGRGYRGKRKDDPLSRGLAAVGTVKGKQVLIGYAAEKGAPALDGEGGNSPYAAALARHLKTPGLGVTDVLRRVRNEVMESTAEQQQPWKEDSLAEEFYFVPPTPDVVVEKPPPPKDSKDPVPPPVVPEWERQWKDVVAGTRNPGTVRKYIEMWKGEPRAAVQVAEAEGLLAKLVKPPPPPVVSGTSSSASGSGTGAPGGGSRVPRPGQVWESPLGMEFVRIPAGRFVMGSPGSEPGRDGDEGPQREVRISRGYWMGRYEVTQGEWEAVMGSNPSRFNSCGSRCPVERVSWEDVQGFLRRLNARESGRGNRYRLPTEAEWEYAARAGTRGARHGELDDVAWWSGNGGDPTNPVGRKRANEWGLHDMLGNVEEWTADWFGKYPSGSVTDPTGPSAGSRRVARGGGGSYIARYVRSANRSYYSPGFRYDDLGFRLVRTK